MHLSVAELFNQNSKKQNRSLSYKTQIISLEERTESENHCD